MIKRLLIFFILVSLFIDSFGQIKKRKEFKIYDALLFKNKPNLSVHGLSDIIMIYDDSILDKHSRHPTNLNARVFNKGRLDRFLDKYKPAKKVPICFDIESWWLMPPYLQASIKKYVEVLSYFKKRNKNNPVGLYGVLPYADAYINEHLRGNKNKNWLSEWELINNSLEEIVEHSDISFPSCYTRTKDINIWKKSVDMQIEKIKKYGKKIPIYAFIWPQYYAAGFSYNNDFIDSTMWREQLEYLYKKCDGIVIWGPPFNLATRAPINWDDKAGWWLETKIFIEKYNIRSN